MVIAGQHSWLIRLVLQNAEDAGLSITGLPVATGGPFAMNLWFQQGEDAGNLFQYLISARDPGLPAIDQTSVFYPNQVSPCRLYVMSPIHLCCRPAS